MTDLDLTDRQRQVAEAWDRMADGKARYRQQVEQLLDHTEALNGLLACYRAGTLPSQKLHKQLAKTSKQWEAIRDEHR